MLFRSRQMSDEDRADTVRAVLFDPGSATTGGIALRAADDIVERLGGLVAPAGADEGRLASLLLGGGGGTEAILVARGGAHRLPAAAERLAVALGVPVRLVDIGATSGRLVDAWPDGRCSAHDIPAAAMVPSDATERRRRCDAVLAAVPELGRAEAADRLGDLAEAPSRDRDPVNDRLRVAAFADALARMGEALADAPRPVGAPVVLVGGVAAATSRGALAIDALRPVVGLGLAHILLDPFGAISALGDPELASSALDRDGSFTRSAAAAMQIGRAHV